MPLLWCNWGAAIALVWVLNTWGFVDLLNGVRGLVELNIASFSFPCVTSPHSDHRFQRSRTLHNGMCHPHRFVARG